MLSIKVTSCVLYADSKTITLLAVVKRQIIYFKYNAWTSEGVNSDGERSKMGGEWSWETTHPPFSTVHPKKDNLKYIYDRIQKDSRLLIEQ